jgi:hypothetical protein
MDVWQQHTHVAFAGGARHDVNLHNHHHNHDADVAIDATRHAFTPTGERRAGSARRRR